MSYVLNPGSGSGTIGGSIADEQVAFGSGTDTIEGDADFKYIKAENALKITQDDSGLIVGAGGSNFDSDYYFQVYGAETRVDSRFPIRIKGTSSETKLITECNEARTGGQEVGQIQLKGLDSASSVVKYGQIQVDVENNAAATKSSSMLFKVAKQDGTFPEIVRFTGGGVVIGNPDDGNEYTLPMGDGANGQVLTTDGSGTVTFQSAGGGGISPRGFIPQGLFTAQNLAQSRPWGTNRSSTASSSDSNPSCRPFFVGQAGTVATMLVRVTGGSSGNYLAGIYSDDGGKPDTLLGQASFAVSGGSGQRTATSFTAADGVTSRTITLAADTQYWYATVKESGNGSIQSTDPTRTPTVMQDDNSNVGNNWYMSVRDSSISNAFEDTWDVSSSSPSTFIPGSVWVIMS